MRSTWWRIGGSLLLGLFVAYLDRTNLSVALPQLSKDLGFAGNNFAVTSSWALTIFLIGYAFANIFGGVFTRALDPKLVVIWCFAIWSVATVVVGFTASVAVLLICRLILGVAEGIYWPQQSRFARAWFPPEDRTKANSIIQYDGQYIALAIGFMLLTPIYQAFGWRVLFFFTGGVGLVVIVPLFLAMLRPESEAPYPGIDTGPQARLTFHNLGGFAFVLMVFSYITQGMLFWGITLWIPLAVRSLGFTGIWQAVASSLPYLAAVVLTIPMARISDRTGKRVLIAALGELIPGVLLLRTTPNIWSVLQSSVAPRAVGPAAGIMNGLGAGGGGTLAGFLVGLLNARTGSYVPGFMVLGALVVLGGLALLAFGRITARTGEAAGAVGGAPAAT